MYDENISQIREREHNTQSEVNQNLSKTTAAKSQPKTKETL